MCARIFYFLLAALFVFLVATIAAFRYLDWWQALLVSAATFLILVLAGRWLVRHTVRMTIGRIGAAAKEFFPAGVRPLRDATADIHAVRPINRASTSPGQRWYEVETTIFPDASQSGEQDHWDLTALRMVPSDLTGSPGEITLTEYEPQELVLMEEGKPVISVDGRVTGPRRLRFVIGVPSTVRELRFRYHSDQFGLLRIPPALPTGLTR